MSTRLQQQDAFFTILLKASKSQAIAILKTINRSQALALCEITINVLNSNIILSRHFKKKLKKHLHLYKIIANKSFRYQKKIQVIHKNPEPLYQLLRAVNKDLIAIINGKEDDLIG
jgi:hypothetical protein